MVRCPNCSTPARTDAKFCTTCGYQFQEADGAASWAGASPANEDAPAWESNDTDPNEGWPAAPAADSPGEVAEEPPSKIDATLDPDSVVLSESESAGFWPESTANPWPAPVPHPGNQDQNVPAEHSLEEPTEQEAISDARSGARAQALDLLEQLRTVIDSIETPSSYDLSGVISDLEVALTPPGALPPDDVADLREALFAARERPRDLDTILHLTKRIDTLAALVIAYDRAIAAIERSLDVLKRAEHPSETENPSPIATADRGR